MVVWFSANRVTLKNFMYGKLTWVSMGSHRLSFVNKIPSRLGAFVTVFLFCIAHVVLGGTIYCCATSRRIQLIISLKLTSVTLLPFIIDVTVT